MMGVSPKVCWFFPVLMMAAGPLNAQFGGPADAAPPDADALIKELQGLKAKQTEVQNRRVAAIIGKLLAASKTPDSAARTYSDAIHDAQFTANAGDAYRFQDWRDKNKDLLTKNKSFGRAAQLHLRYLAISLQRAANLDAAPPLRELWDYALSLSEAVSEYGESLVASDAGKALLETSITTSPVAQANLITADLEKLGSAEWETKAGELDGILEKNIRGPLRALKDPRLLDTWKLQISLRQKNMEKARGDLAKATFEQVELPRLYWGQARDLIVIGQKNRGIAEMARLARSYPNHPDFSAWVDEVTATLHPPAKTSSEPVSNP